MPHIHDLIDFTIDVYIVYQDKVLLRKHDKYNLWLGVGGHIELDEDPNQSGVREAKEEVGLVIELVGKMPSVPPSEGYRELLPPSFMNIHYINRTHQHISLIYFAKSNSSQITETVDREISLGCKWFTKEELNQNAEISDIIKHYAAQALEMVNLDGDAK